MQNVRVFISHSSKDVDLAASLVELLRMSLNLHTNEIRCTSVSGYKLPGGEHTAVKLRTEIDDSQVFVALLTPNSLSSSYALFEIGARWGSHRHLIPVVARGTKVSALPKPIDELHALDSQDQNDIHSLVSQIAEELKAKAENPASYTDKLKSFAMLSIADKPELGAAAIPTSPQTPPVIFSDDEVKILKLLSQSTQQHGMTEQSIMSQTQLSTQRFKFAIKQLEEAQVIESYHNVFAEVPTRHELSHEGRRLAIAKGWI